jgi:hypothetical protein
MLGLSLGNPALNCNDDDGMDCSLISAVFSKKSSH